MKIPEAVRSGTFGERLTRASKALPSHRTAWWENALHESNGTYAFKPDESAVKAVLDTLNVDATPLAVRMVGHLVAEDSYNRLYNVALDQLPPRVWAVRDEFGRTPVHVAALHGTDWVMRLAARKTNLDARTAAAPLTQGLTLAHLAAASSSETCVEVALELMEDRTGAAMSVSDRFLNTPAHYAAAFEKSGCELFWTLCAQDRGCLEHKNVDGQTPAELMSEAGIRKMSGYALDPWADDGAQLRAFKSEKARGAVYIAFAMTIGPKTRLSRNEERQLVEAGMASRPSPATSAAQLARELLNRVRPVEHPMERPSAPHADATSAAVGGGAASASWSAASTEASPIQKLFEKNILAGESMPDANDVDFRRPRTHGDQSTPDEAHASDRGPPQIPEGLTVAAMRAFFDSQQVLPSVGLRAAEGSVDTPTERRTPGANHVELPDGSAHKELGAGTGSATSASSANDLARQPMHYRWGRAGSSGDGTPSWEPRNEGFTRESGVPKRFGGAKPDTGASTYADSWVGAGRGERIGAIASNASGSAISKSRDMSPMTRWPSASPVPPTTTPRMTAPARPEAPVPLARSAPNENSTSRAVRGAPAGSPSRAIPRVKQANEPAKPRRPQAFGKSVPSASATAAARWEAMLQPKAASPQPKRVAVKRPSAGPNTGHTPD